MHRAMALLLVALLPVAVRAQELRGTVTDSLLDRPIAGTVVQVLTASGQPLSRTLTNARGQFRAQLPKSAAHVRLLHIGYQPRTIALASERGELTTLEVRMTLLRTMLSAVEVRDNPNCAPRRDRVMAMALWEQVRQGLLATIVAREAAPAELKVIRYQRFLDGLSSKITSQDVYQHRVSSATRPFLAVRSAGDFVRRGFVGDSAHEKIYYAPDADVLTEDAFFLAYCFRIAEPNKEHAGHVGLSFAVAKRRTDRVDVEGTVWVDTTVRELRALEFEYVGVGQQESRFNPGGHLAFRRMENGSVLIDRWGLKLVALRYDTVVTRPGEVHERQWFELHEAGGELAHARWSDGSTWQASLGALRADAKTKEGAAVVGASVFLEYSNYEAVTDSSGEFEIRDLLPGPYSLMVNDTTMAKINVKLRTKLSFDAARDSTHSTVVIIPTPMDYATQNCGIPKKFANSLDVEQAALFVLVVSPDGQPVKGLDYQIQYMADPLHPPLYSSRLIGAKTDREGRIWKCWGLGLGRWAAVFLAAPGVMPLSTIVKTDERVNVLKIVWDPSKRQQQ